MTGSICNVNWIIVRLTLGAAFFSRLKGEEVERHPNDGWYNNLIHPDWGAIDSHLLRRSPTNYSDGVYQPSGMDRPNPLDISRIAFNGSNDLGSARNRNALLVFFGQQLVEEIMDAQRPGCPIEYFNIKVPKNHTYNPDGKDDLEMPFLRARYDQRTGYSPNNPRQQLNEITPFMDGNLVYGAGKAVEDALREFKDGRLKQSDPDADIKSSFPVKNDIRLPYANPPSPRDHVLRPVSRFNRYGNPRTHENPFLTALAVVWFRYHNYIAGEIKAKDGSLDDEQIFNAARKRVIAQYQKITMYDWLPVWLNVSSDSTRFNMNDYPYHGGGKNPYAGYDPSIHPGITSEFQAAALRYGHTLVPSGVVTKSISRNVCRNSTRMVKSEFTNSNKTSEVHVRGVRLCNSYWVPEETVENGPGMDELIRGMIYTRAAREDNILVSDIREFVFGPLEWSRRDLGALNIQRGRDLGLPGYNEVREAYGLKRKIRWTDINPNYNGILKELQSLYGGGEAPDDLDLFPGGLLETTLNGPGELFTAITLDQFLRIRHGDRFWFENRNNRLFSDFELAEIHSTSFYHVLKSVTRALDYEHLTLVTDVFLCGNSTSLSSSECECADPKFDDVETQEVCVGLKHYDYFSGSESSFVVTILVIILSLPITVGIMLGMSRSRRNSLDAMVDSGPRVVHVSESNEFYATEWIGRTTYGLLNSRDVKITLDDQRVKIFVINLRGDVVRMIDLRRKLQHEKHKPKALATRSYDKGNKLMMVKVPGEIDLVLHFATYGERDDSFSQLKQFFQKHGWEFSEEQPMAENVMWREAVTIDQRKEVLARFFKSVLAELSGKEGLDKQDHIDEVLTTKLTRTEFAEALGLQPHSLFVRNMFLLVDSSGDGFVSFDEFVSHFGILMSGKSDQKAEMFFKMFDTSRTGRLTKENYKKMIMYA